MAKMRLRAGFVCSLLGLVLANVTGCVGVNGSRPPIAMNGDERSLPPSGPQRSVFATSKSRVVAPEAGNEALPGTEASAKSAFLNRANAITPVGSRSGPGPTIGSNTATPIATVVGDTGPGSSSPALILDSNAQSVHIGGGPTAGCTTCSHRRHGDVVTTSLTPAGPHGDCPTETDRVSLPPYKVAPPDILFIDLIRIVPRPPYRLQPLETLVVTVTETLPGQPIAGPFVISPEGTINLGFSYGSVNVAGMTIDQAQVAVRNFLSRILRNPQVTVALAQFRGFQAIRGEHLVRMDGTVSLGVYGSVYVAGLSLGQAKCVIEKHLSEYFLNPEISIDVFAYNSRKIYVIVDGGYLGQQVFPLDVTGNETVLDAISRVQGLAPVSSKRRIWVARPAPPHMGCSQILPVNWRAITEAGSTATNYQLFPGDRVYVAANPIIAFDNLLSIVLAPVERLLGVTFLAQQVANGGTTNSGN